LEFVGARARNLKDIDVRIPLGTLTCVTGVSGAGKSTLLHEVVHHGLLHRFGRLHHSLESVVSDIRGHEHLKRVVEVDHNPIGRTPRSIPATYVGVWDQIRKLFSMLPESRARGYTASRFSFNVKGGRCEECKGQGQVRVEMNFLPDVYVPCEACGGTRFNDETLAMRYRKKSISGVLGLSMEEAAEFFGAFPKIARPFQILTDLGLGYLSLGQSSPTLSGGEAQRIKLAGELGSGRQPTLYILDEPSTGLHRADVKRLLDMLRALRDQGHTVLVIEHNMDLVWAADHVIDIGPGSGPNGGRIAAQGTPPEIVRTPGDSLTAGALAGYLIGPAETE
jgi:excinuclease ABC subunit A